MRHRTADRPSPDWTRLRPRPFLCCRAHLSAGCTTSAAAWSGYGRCAEIHEAFLALGCW